MKMNVDCIRDVLLYLEENLTYVEGKENLFQHAEINVQEIIDAMKQNYNVSDISYSIEQLIKGEYISTGMVVHGNNEELLICNIKDITWEGHEFLNSVRPKEVWQTVKEGIKTFGTMSLNVMKQYAETILMQLITNPDNMAKAGEFISKLF